MIRVILGLLLLAGCGSSGPSVDQGTVGHLTFSVPAGWQSRDISDHYTKRVEWTPPDNTGSESLVIMRSSPRPTVTTAPSGYLESLLETAQQTLPRGEFSKPVRFTSNHGMPGVRITGKFVPPNREDRYRRVHAVLVDGTELVHVLYTARDADDEAFEIVIDSIREGG